MQQRSTGRQPYRGRFAPSPTGPLHQGSLVSALASYLDARAHHGQWLIRIEDIDLPRTVPGAAQEIIRTLQGLGMQSDETPLWQSRRSADYRHAFGQLNADALLYPCRCSRREIADALAFHPEHPPSFQYAGLCRSDDASKAGSSIAGKPPAWRLLTSQATESTIVEFDDRWCGPQKQDLAREVGDFVVKRADRLWAYQLAVVVDDAASRITHIVRGADLLDSTPRQIYLQRCLRLATPRYMHVPVLTNERGEKLSKQTEAPPIDSHRPLVALRQAAAHLGFDINADTIDNFYSRAIEAWKNRWASVTRAP